MKLLHFIIALLTILISTTFTLLFANSHKGLKPVCYCEHSSEGHSFPTIKSLEHSVLENKLEISFHPHRANYQVRVKMEDGSEVTGKVAKADSAIVITVPSASYGGGSVNIFSNKHLLESHPF